MGRRGSARGAELSCGSARLDSQQEVLTERCINGILWPYSKAEYRDPVVLGRLAEHTKQCLQGTKVHTRVSQQPQV